MSLIVDPDALEGAGATFTGTRERRVVGPHRFLCVGEAATASYWTPLFSSDGPGRVLVPSDGRSGAAEWLEGVFYAHPGQIWTVADRSVMAAAMRDRSRPGNRARLRPQRVPDALRRWQPRAEQEAAPVDDVA